VEAHRYGQRICETKASVLVIGDGDWAMTEETTGLAERAVPKTVPGPWAGIILCGVEHVNVEPAQIHPFRPASLDQAWMEIRQRFLPRPGKPCLVHRGAGHPLPGTPQELRIFPEPGDPRNRDTWLTVSMRIVSLELFGS